ncbi:GNAT family N-acetyltransferase [Roseibium sp. HPY-6]|uniref:GNAT family N-acetyltransferase n=1 Tax=Roseibium sp. HPY-6 TaxID=3229852 RepID=UPI00338DE101
MTHLPELRTRRLVLRPISLGDTEAVIELAGKDFQVARWLTSFSWPYEDGSAEAFLDTVIEQDPLETEAVFAITLGGVFIGVVAVEAPGDLKELPNAPTIGYWIGRAFQGHGYAREAVEAALDWAFGAFATDVIAARAYEENTRSRALLRKVGFKPYSITERFAKPLDRRVSNVVVRLSQADFEKQRVPA